MKYQLAFSLACCALSHNYTHAMPHPNQYHNQQTPYLLHHAFPPVNHAPHMQLAIREDTIKISRQIADLHLATSCGFTSLDSKICLAQRACDVLAQCQHSQENTNAQTNDLMNLLMQQIEHQNEQQKLILSSLAVLAQQKVTHEIATQTDASIEDTSRSVADSAASAQAGTPTSTTQTHLHTKPIYHNPSKNFLAWQNKQKQASHTQRK